MAQRQQQHLNCHVLIPIPFAFTWLEPKILWILGTTKLYLFVASIWDRCRSRIWRSTFFEQRVVRHFFIVLQFVLQRKMQKMFQFLSSC
jgi:hypothetical protein